MKAFDQVYAHVYYISLQIFNKAVLSIFLLLVRKLRILYLFDSLRLPGFLLVLLGGTSCFDYDATFSTLSSLALANQITHFMV